MGVEYSSWQRIGTGYVYSDKYVSDEEALQQFKNHLDKKGMIIVNQNLKILKCVLADTKDYCKKCCCNRIISGFMKLNLMVYILHMNFYIH